MPQSCAAWRTNGSGFAQPLILDAMLRMRSVAEAPTPPQSSTQSGSLVHERAYHPAQKWQTLAPHEA